ncbi:MAG: hypothetical protein HC894_13810 [Microcoleus sp. SM1_3_4]|nr:hypothetical protein [Microcoleus sp. SM1_3_4]
MGVMRQKEEGERGRGRDEERKRGGRINNPPILRYAPPNCQLSTQPPASGQALNCQLSTANCQLLTVN